eukprot:TRINITY_DN32378_c0_g1_i1.p1 TRINITY_DN32378_c0_g1~~TRINITY_DN32378_c0_g1_i1.p1  ORF type:complete len:952 (-),score=170.94 TRINITY_DN32378_c0_g1_i1:82-2898(-)
MSSSVISALAPPILQSSLARSQMEFIQRLVKKHLTDPSFTEIGAEDFTLTSLDRGIERFVHENLATALDVLVDYQGKRKTTYFNAMGLRAQTSMSAYRNDPRTRVIELLKRWLRQQAVNENVGEEEVRRMCSLCRELLNNGSLFPSRNKTSFMHALSQVYEHLQKQLQQVLERDRSCAEQAKTCLTLSRNMISDSIAFLLTSPTDLKQTDRLPSTGIGLLTQSLPPSDNPLPASADPQLQDIMEDAWKTHVGRLLARLIALPWTQLLYNAGVPEEAATLQAQAGSAASTAVLALPDPAGNSPVTSFRDLLEVVRKDFAEARFKNSGLAGPFREDNQEDCQKHFLAATEALFELLYLLGEVLIHFHRISDSMGDYGMIRVASWLHPIIESIIDKVKRLKQSLEGVHSAMERAITHAQARGVTVKKPLPTKGMLKRGHDAIERAVVSRDCHANELIQSLEELKRKSATERLPQVYQALGDACAQLQFVLGSSQFRAVVGESFPQLPPTVQMGRPAQMSPALAIADGAEGGIYSETEDEGQAASSLSLPARAVARRSTEPSSREAGVEIVDCASSGYQSLPVPLPGIQSGKAVTFDLAGRQQEDISPPVKPPASCLPGFFACQAKPEPRQSTSSSFRQFFRQSAKETAVDQKSELVSELDPKGWISHEVGGRIMWHHKSLGPAPWETAVCTEEGAKGASTEQADVAHPRKSSNPFDDELDAQGSRLQKDTNPFADDVQATNPFSDAPEDTNPFAGDREAGADMRLPLPRERAVSGSSSASVTPSPARTLSPPSVASSTTVHGASSFQASPVVQTPPPDRGPVRTEVDCQVWRLEGGVQGWQRHDRRRLELAGSRLLIYDKGSMDQVKTVVDLSKGQLTRCDLAEEDVLSLKVERKRRPSLFSSSAAREVEQKHYFFQFDTPSLAAELKEAIECVRQQRTHS